jgi:hypothetical protein
MTTLLRLYERQPRPSSVLTLAIIGFLGLASGFSTPAHDRAPAPPAPAKEDDFGALLKVAELGVSKLTEVKVSPNTEVSTIEMFVVGRGLFDIGHREFIGFLRATSIRSEVFAGVTIRR